MPTVKSWQHVFINFIMCEKTKYMTRAIARQRLSEIQLEKHRRKKTPVRPYECPICGFWHITSKPPNEYWLKEETINTTINDEHRTENRPHLHRSRPRYTEGYAERIG